MRLGPNVRVCGWGFVAAGRFLRGEREAVVLTLDPAGSYYTGFQISDPWTISPDPMHRVVSLNKAQTALNPDGTTTFVLSSTDPGIANWIATVSLAERWMLLRWQGVPPGAAASRFIHDVRTVSLDALVGALHEGVPTPDWSGRHAQIARRARRHPG